MPTGDEWEERWREDNTPWDLGGVTPALDAWCKENPIRDQDILVPGCGRGHDAHYMSKRGARVVALDISPEALETARRAYPDSRVQWQVGDVTAVRTENSYDLVWEYTCFCALEPSMREPYFQGLARSLKPGGTYQGLVFHKVPDPENGPPFQIEPDAFHRLLGNHFEPAEFEADTIRSVKSRRGSEIWFRCLKKSY